MGKGAVMHLTLLQMFGPMCHYLDPETQQLCAMGTPLHRVVPKHKAANAVVL